MLSPMMQFCYDLLLKNNLESISVISAESISGRDNIDVDLTRNIMSYIYCNENYYNTVIKYGADIRSKIASKYIPGAGGMLKASLYAATAALFDKHDNIPERGMQVIIHAIHNAALNYITTDLNPNTNYKYIDTVFVIDNSVDTEVGVSRPDDLCNLLSLILSRDIITRMHRYLSGHKFNDFSILLAEVIYEIYALPYYSQVNNESAPYNCENTCDTEIQDYYKRFNLSKYSFEFEAPFNQKALVEWFKDNELEQKSIVDINNLLLISLSAERE